MKQDTIITYIGSDEVLITTPELEAECIRLYFTEGGRDLEEYDREEHTPTDAIQIKLSMETKVW